MGMLCNDLEQALSNARPRTATLKLKSRFNSNCYRKKYHRKRGCFGEAESGKSQFELTHSLTLQLVNKR